MQIAALFLILAAIMILVWIFILREPKEKDVEVLQNTGGESLVKPDDTSIIGPSDNAIDFPPSYIDDIKLILGPDIENPQISIVWDTFIERPEDPDYYELIAQPLLACGSDMKAKELLELSLKYLPANEKLLTLLGKACGKISDIDGMKAAYERAYREFPESPDAPANYASALITLGDYEEAKNLLADVLSRHSNNVKARLFYGISLYYVGNYEDAYMELNTVYKKDQRIPQTHYYIGLSLNELGEYTTARKALQKYLDMYPNGPYSIDAQRVLDKMPKDEE